METDRKTTRVIEGIANFEIVNVAWRWEMGDKIIACMHACPSERSDCIRIEALPTSNATLHSGASSLVALGRMWHIVSPPTFPSLSLYLLFFHLFHFLLWVTHSLPFLLLFPLLFTPLHALTLYLTQSCPGHDITLYYPTLHNTSPVSYLQCQ